MDSPPQISPHIYSLLQATLQSMKALNHEISSLNHDLSSFNQELSYHYPPTTSPWNPYTTQTHSHTTSPWTSYNTFNQQPPLTPIAPFYHLSHLSTSETITPHSSNLTPTSISTNMQLHQTITTTNLNLPNHYQPLPSSPSPPLNFTSSVSLSVPTETEINAEIPKKFQEVTVTEFVTDPIEHDKVAPLVLTTEKDVITNNKSVIADFVAATEKPTGVIAESVTEMELMTHGDVVSPEFVYNTFLAPTMVVGNETEQVLIEEGDNSIITDFTSVSGASKPFVADSPTRPPPPKPPDLLLDQSPSLMHPPSPKIPDRISISPSSLLPPPPLPLKPPDREVSTYLDLSNPYPLTPPPPLLQPRLMPPPRPPDKVSVSPPRRLEHYLSISASIKYSTCSLVLAEKKKERRERTQSRVLIPHRQMHQKNRRKNHSHSLVAQSVYYYCLSANQRPRFFSTESNYTGVQHHTICQKKDRTSCHFFKTNTRHHHHLLTHALQFHGKTIQYVSFKDGILPTQFSKLLINMLRNALDFMRGIIHSYFVPNFNYWHVTPNSLKAAFNWNFADILLLCKPQVLFKFFPHVGASCFLFNACDFGIVGKYFAGDQRIPVEMSEQYVVFTALMGSQIVLDNWCSELNFEGLIGVVNVAFTQEAHRHYLLDFSVRIATWKQWDPGENFFTTLASSSIQFKQWDPGDEFLVSTMACFYQFKQWDPGKFCNYIHFSSTLRTRLM